jgi:hypothetical protein
MRTPAACRRARRRWNRPSPCGPRASAALLPSSRPRAGRFRYPDPDTTCLPSGENATETDQGRVALERLQRLLPSPCPRAGLSYRLTQTLAACRRARRPLEKTEPSWPSSVCSTCSRRRVPEPDCIIPRPRQHLLAVRREGQ